MKKRVSVGVNKVLRGSTKMAFFFFSPLEETVT